MAIQQINVSNVTEFTRYEAENLNFTRPFTGDHLSISLDKYAPGVRTPKLYKRRPDNGKEVILPFKGKLKIMTDDQDFLADPETNGLSLHIIDSLTTRNFENVGKPIPNLAS